MVKASKSDKLKVGLIQTRVSANIGLNLDKTAKLVQEASKEGATIVCLQELFATQYFAQKEDKKSFELAEEVHGKLTNFLSKTASNNKITLIGGSIFEKDEGSRYYNTSLIFDAQGNLAARYRKVHIPYDPKYYEQYYFSPGNLGYVQLQVGNVKIAPLICYDQWYPEAARVNALRGAKIIFYPTAIGWFDDLKKFEPFSAKRWESSMCAHASMNGIYVVAVNRVGKEEELDFWGNSFVADPFGEVIARASSSKEEVLVVEIDLKKVTESQEGWGFLRNRKPETYKELCK